MAQPAAKRLKPNNPLDDVWEDMDKQAAQAKRQKELNAQQEKNDNIAVISRLLLKTEAEFKSGRAQGNIEVEVRFGQSLHIGFESSVKASEIALLLAVVARSREPVFQFVETAVTEDYSWKPPAEIADPNANYRITYAVSDSGAKYIKTTEKKTKIGKDTLTWPYQVPQFPYQARVSVATEQPVSFEQHQIPEDYAVHKRVKTRKIYNCGDRKNPELLQLHVTTVVSSDGTVAYPDAGENPKTTNEVELELRHEAMRMVLEHPDSSKLLPMVAARIYTVLEFLQRQFLVMQTEMFPDIFPVKLSQANREDHHDMHARIKQRLTQSFPNYKSDEFPGSMPITLSRQHFQVLREPEEHQYFISEKTDGIRYMMFIGAGSDPQTGSGVYLIDRSFTVYQVPEFMEGHADLRGILAPNADTLLDGEMIRHAKTDKPYFMIFDIVMLNGKYLGDETLDKRLQAIGSGIVQPFRERRAALESAGEDPKMIPFELIGKVLVPIAQGDSVLKQIFPAPKGERYFKDNKRCHKTDGLIFTPGGPYQIKTCDTLYKWKYLDKQTIDFGIKFPRHEEVESMSSTNVEMWISGGASDIVCKVVPLSHDDYGRLKQDINNAGLSSKNTMPIAEMSYDIKRGRWRYHFLRLDKQKPNFIRVAWDTMEAIAQNISYEEIKALVRDFGGRAHRAATAPEDRASSFNPNPHPPGSYVPPNSGAAQAAQGEEDLMEADEPYNGGQANSNRSTGNEGSGGNLFGM